jgi:hypothetical protein
MNNIFAAVKFIAKHISFVCGSFPNTFGLNLFQSFLMMELLQVLLTVLCLAATLASSASDPFLKRFVDN